MRRENKLQVFISGVWLYVFCYDQYGSLITTVAKRKGLRGENLSFFKNKYSNFEFRVI